MTVSNTLYRAGPYHSGGDEGENVFNFFFKIFQKEDVRVVLKSALGVESDMLLDVDFTVTMNPDQDENPGGYIETEESFPFDAVRTVTVVSNIPELQSTQLVNAGQWNPRVVEDGIDKAMLVDHQVRGRLERAIVFPITEEDLPAVEIPAKEIRANTSLGFDADGNLVVTSGFLAGEVVVSAFGEAFVAVPDAAGALDQLGVSAFVQGLLPAADDLSFLGGLGGTAVGISLFQAPDASFIQGLIGISAFGGTLLDDANSDAALATLGVTPYMITVNTTAGSAGGLLTLLGFSAFGITLTDDANAAAARTTLGLGTIATQDAATVAITGGSIVGITDLALADGGTGASTQAGAFTAIVAAGGTMTGEINHADQLVTRPLLKDYSIESEAVTSAAGILTLDMTTGNAFTVTLSENIAAVVVSNPPAPGTFGELWLAFTQPPAQNYTVTWAATYLFPGGTDHAMSAGDNEVDVLHLKTVNGGTTWFVDFKNAYA